MKYARLMDCLQPVVSGVALIGLWYVAKAAFGIPTFVLPSPEEILRAAGEERRPLLSAAMVTVRGAVLGFFLAVSVGFLLAIALGFSPRIKASFYPYILILQMMPVTILAPVFVLWLGQGLPSIVAITFMIGFFPVVANTTMGFISVDRNLRELFLMCKATRMQEVRYLRIPGAMPYFLTGMKIAGTLAPIGAIVGDFLAGSAENGVGGIGFLTISYFSQLKTPALFATGLVACVMGFLFVGGVNWLHWRLLHSWHDSMVKRNEHEPFLPYIPSCRAARTRGVRPNRMRGKTRCVRPRGRRVRRKAADENRPPDRLVCPAGAWRILPGAGQGVLPGGGTRGADRAGRAQRDPAAESRARLGPVLDRAVGRTRHRRESRDSAADCRRPHAA
jgi:NitT/TauT family transport system permease protein